MQNLTEKVFRLNPPGGLFDETVVRNLYPHSTNGARRLFVHRAASKGEVLRLKTGIYCLSEEFRRKEAHPFVVSSVLLYPSHVSFESALSHYGLIPEAVFGVSCVTILRSREFLTPLGHFSYRRVPVKRTRAGVTAKRFGDQWAFVAAPLRALSDLAYLRSDVDWKNEWFEFLTESMRIEPEELRSIPLDSYREIYDAFRSRRVRDFLAHLKKELGQ